MRRCECGMNGGMRTKREYGGVAISRTPHFLYLIHTLFRLTYGEPHATINFWQKNPARKKGEAMNQKMTAIILVASASIASCGYREQNEKISLQTSGLSSREWRTSSQNDRNQAILARAFADFGAYVGVNCKTWASKIVRDANGGAFSLPWNAPSPNDYYWEYSAHVGSNFFGIYNAEPGWIVQMRVLELDGSVGPHTAIVADADDAGVTFIESNWCPNNCATVSMRFVPFESFGSPEIPDYTAYYILR